jgi:hypothetical protein
MKARLALAVVLLSAAACADEPKKQVAPTAPPAASMSAAVATPPNLRASTVCLSYATNRTVVQAELKDKPTSERLQKRLASLDQLIRDACQ